MPLSSLSARSLLPLDRSLRLEINQLIGLASENNRGESNQTFPEVGEKRIASHPRCGYYPLHLLDRVRISPSIIYGR